MLSNDLRKIEWVAKKVCHRSCTVLCRLQNNENADKRDEAG